MKVYTNNSYYADVIYNLLPGCNLFCSADVDSALELTAGVVVLDRHDRIVSTHMMRWLRGGVNRWLLFADDPRWRERLVEIADKLHQEYVQQVADPVTGLDHSESAT